MLSLFLLILCSGLAVFAMEPEMQQNISEELVKEIRNISKLPFAEYKVAMKKKFPNDIKADLKLRYLLTALANDDIEEVQSKIYFLKNKMHVSINSDFATGTVLSALSAHYLRCLRPRTLRNITILLANGADPFYKAPEELESPIQTISQLCFTPQTKNLFDILASYARSENEQELLEYKKMVDGMAQIRAHFAAGHTFYKMPDESANDN